ncbi:MAG TPA: hypothetical protein VF741_08235, partial [Candidatus Aquilonibacter sp.]
MNVLRRLGAAAAALLMTTGLTARGFAPSQVADETKYEAVVAASPTETQARIDELALAGYVHRMGTPGDLR